MKPSILVPFDFSESAEAALKWASDLRASTSSPPIEIVHAIDLRPLVVADPPAVPTEDEIRGLDRMLQATAARLDIPARTRVIVGPSPIGDAIVDVAREEKVDLIVMGTHGKTGLRRLLLGSVAENVIRYAECPVLVVREPRAKAIGS
jgi:universal stress protein A